MNPISNVEPKIPNSAMQQILDAHAEMGPLPIESLTPELARLIPLPDRAAVAVYGQHFTKKALAPMPMPVGTVLHKIIQTGESDLLVRVYTPKGDLPQGGWPILVYFHGGGWVIANLDTYDASCRALCDGAMCVVASVHYRQAPENPWPAAAEDAFNAYQWIVANAASLQGNGSKIAIAGESAGGNLATVVTLMAKAQGAPQPLHQVLVYPVTDMIEGPNSASALTYASAKPLNTPMLHWFYGHYVPDLANRVNPFVSPIYQEDFQGVPPATIILAEIDPLRSEGEAYANKLKAAGIPVNLQIYEGVTHEFFGLVGLVKESGEAVALAVKDLKAAFER